MDEKLILFNDLGELILARATRDRDEELARVSVLSGEICWTQPALSHGRLFVRNQSRAACVFLGDPQSLQQEVRSQAMTTAEIPQAAYFDWASVMLGVEPEYAFDLPSMTWLKLWFQICLFGIMCGCLLITAMLTLIPNFRKASRLSRETTFWAMVFLVGACGTTVLSPMLNEFVFTWPVCLFAVFQPFIDRVVLKRRPMAGHERLQSGLSCVIFLGGCLLYFLACRRLSLVFEWVFLGGFFAAVPFSLAARHLLRARRWYPRWQILATALAFAAFFWSSVVYQYLRVR